MKKTKDNADILDDAFLQSTFQFADRTFRAVTLGSFALLRRVENQFVTGTDKNGPEFDLASFLLIHEKSVDEACRLAYDPREFFGAVVAYASEFDLAQLQDAGEFVSRMVTSAGLGKVQTEGTGKPPKE